MFNLFWWTNTYLTTDISLLNNLLTFWCCKDSDMAFLIQTISRFFCKTTHYFDEYQTFVCVHKWLFLAYILILCCDDALLVPFFLFLIRFVGCVLRTSTHALLVLFFRCIYIIGVSCVAFTCKEVGTKRR